MLTTKYHHEKSTESLEFNKYIELRTKAYDLVKLKSGDELRYYSPIEGQPYWTHLMNVHNFLIVQGVKDYEVLIASILHDIVEDSNITIKQISNEYTPRIAQLVSLTTKPKERYDSNVFYSAILEDEDACKIKLADRIDNMLTNYCYSKQAMRTGKYIEETKSYFIPMAEKVGWQNELSNAMTYYEKHIN